MNKFTKIRRRGSQQQRTDAPLLLSVAQGAALLGVPQWTLRQQIKAGTGPRTKRVGRRIYIVAEALREWIEQNEN